MAITGKNESSRLTTTRRVRNFEPATPCRRSAYSFSRLRNKTTVSATKAKKIRPLSPAKNSRCSLLSGLMNFRLNEPCNTRIASSRNAPIASAITAFRRPEVRGSSRIGSNEAKDCPIIGRPQPLVFTNDSRAAPARSAALRTQAWPHSSGRMAAPLPASASSAIRSRNTCR